MTGKEWAKRSWKYKLKDHVRRMFQKCRSCIDTEEKIQCSLNSMSDHNEDKILKARFQWGQRMEATREKFKYRHRPYIASSLGWIVRIRLNITMKISEPVRCKTETNLDLRSDFFQKDYYSRENTSTSGSTRASKPEKGFSYIRRRRQGEQELRGGEGQGAGMSRLVKSGNISPCGQPILSSQNELLRGDTLQLGACLSFRWVKFQGPMGRTD